MDDLISRQAILDTLDHMDKALDTDRTVETYKELLVECFKQLPSVNPQERTGHWIEKMDACECPYCHKAWDYYDNDTEDFEYCPKCGAKLSENPTGSEPQERSE